MLAVIWGLLGCAAESTGSNDANSGNPACEDGGCSDGAGTVDTGSGDRSRFRRQLPPGLTRIPPAEVEHPDPAVGEAPVELFQAARARAADLSGRSPGSFELEVSEAVNWPDGSLGCARPGQFYSQAPVAGFRLILEAQGSRYQFHSGAEPQNMVLCRVTGPDADRLQEFGGNPAISDRERPDS